LWFLVGLLTASITDPFCQTADCQNALRRFNWLIFGAALNLIGLQCVKNVDAFKKMADMYGNTIEHLRSGAIIALR
jgi:hypothetical protein